MKYRRLGSTGLTVSVVGIGAWQFGGEWGKDFTQDEVSTMLDCARDLGMNLVDTAECYGDHLSERLVGEALRSHRDDWYIASKFGHRYLGDGTRRAEWSSREVRAQLDRSLHALQTDRIDLYQFHSGDDAAFDDDELWEALREQQQAGKIRHLGVSIGDNRSARQPRMARDRGAEVIQVRYSALDREPEQAVLGTCTDQDLGVLAREPLAAGLLGGKYRPGVRFDDSSDTRSHRDPVELDRRCAEALQLLEEQLPGGVDPAAWSLAWVLRDVAVTAAIPGCKTVGQVRINATAAELIPSGGGDGDIGVE